MIIAPSLLSANFLNLEKDIQMINESKAEWLHLDVIDGQFAPNITFGIPVIEAIRKATNKFIDAHLMIEKPEYMIEAFVKAGVDSITVHYEACTHLHRVIQQIKSYDIKAGVALNPHTSIQSLDCVIADLDMVLLMSVNPGFSGQKFIESTYTKLRKLVQNRYGNGDLNNFNYKIQIDGGVSLDNAAKLKSYGADVVVAGNAIFKSENPLETINNLYGV
jgi:ribulose-phosphate 3-epimerase